MPNSAAVASMRVRCGMGAVPRGGTASRPRPKRTSYGSFFAFSDPDGNAWLVQEVTTRRPAASDAASASAAHTSRTETLTESLQSTHLREGESP